MSRIVLSESSGANEQEAVFGHWTTFLHVPNNCYFDAIMFGYRFISKDLHRGEPLLDLGLLSSVQFPELILVSVIFGVELVHRVGWRLLELLPQDLITLTLPQPSFVYQLRLTPRRFFPCLKRRRDSLLGASINLLRRLRVQHIESIHGIVNARGIERWKGLIQR